MNGRVQAELFGLFIVLVATVIALMALAAY